MTNKRLQFRRGTSAEHSSFTGAAGELTVNTTNTSVHVHDNSTAGGIEIARADLENISPDQAVDFNGQVLSNIGTPASSADAATKAYVDASFAGGNLSQLTDVSLGTLSSGELIAYNGSNWVNIEMSGDASIDANGLITITGDAVTNDMLAANSVNTDQVVDASITNAKIANSQIVISDGVNADSTVALGSTLSFQGTANQTTVSQTSGTVTVGLTDDLTVAATLTVSGNLIVSGTTTTVNTATVSIQDNIMTLNSDATGTPTENAGLEIERGDSTNATLQWNETSDDWELSIGGGTFFEIAHAGNANSVITSMITDANVTTAKIADLGVTTAKIANGAVTSLKIEDASITDDHLADDAVTTIAILDANVTTAKIAADAITNAKIADDAVGAEHLDFLTGAIQGASGSILIGNGSSAFAELAISGDVSLNSSGAVTIGNSAVTTVKINDAAVTTVKLADSNVTTAKIADSNITTAKILDANVTTAKIADSNVTTAKIADDATTPAKISVFNDSLVANTSGNLLVTDGVNGFTNVAMSGDATLAASGAITIANSAVETAMIADANVTNAKMAPNSVSTSNIIDANVTNAKLATNAVSTSNIVDDAVTQAKINAGAVGTTELATDSVTSAKITDANVTAAKIADGNVTTIKIADDAVTQAKISAGAVGTSELANAAVTATQIAASVAGSGLSGGAGSALSVNVDDSTVEFNGGGDIAIKASGVTSGKIADAAVVEAKIASGAVTTAKIANGAVTATQIADTTITGSKLVENTITQTQINGSSVFTVSADSGTPDGIPLGETLAILGTDDEISTTVGANQITLGLPTNVNITDLNVLSDLNVTQDFNVTGILTMNNGSNITTFTHPNGIVVNGSIQTDAAVYRMVHTSQTGTVNVGDSHHIIICSATATINLPSAGTSGRELIIKNASASDTVTIAASAGETAEVVSLAATESVTLVSDGSSDWYSI